MNKKNQEIIISLLLVLIPIISLFIGFIFNEDLSTGGSRYDFKVTWPLIIDYSNLNFLDARLEAGAKPRHLPFHYMLLAATYKIFNDQNLVRIIYLFFSLLMPIFLYLNLSKIYDNRNRLILILSFSFLFFPFFRSSALWPNAHLTALIFFLISNFFYLKAIEQNKFFNKILNLFFLALATYTLQTFVIFFVFYLYKYLRAETKKNFLKLFIICVFLGIPALYFLALNEKMLKLPISKNLFYTITNNFSIMFFLLLFFLFNKQNYKILFNQFKSLKIVEIFSVIFLFLIIIFNLDYNLLNFNMRGGGFFYKISHFFFDNNIIFLTSFFLALLTIYLLIKEDFNFFYIIIFINIMGLNHQIYQKYFEPLFLVMILILYKNSFSKNLIIEKKYVLIFYLLIISYYLLALINFYYGFTYKMTV